jgi:hypothetical protein
LYFVLTGDYSFPQARQGGPSLPPSNYIPYNPTGVQPQQRFGIGPSSSPSPSSFQRPPVPYGPNNPPYPSYQSQSVAIPFAPRQLQGPVFPNNPARKPNFQENTANQGEDEPISFEHPILYGGKPTSPPVIETRVLIQGLDKSRPSSVETRVLSPEYFANSPYPLHENQALNEFVYQPTSVQRQPQQYFVQPQQLQPAGQLQSYQRFPQVPTSPAATFNNLGPQGYPQPNHAGTNAAYQFGPIPSQQPRYPVPQGRSQIPMNNMMLQQQQIQGVAGAFSQKVPSPSTPLPSFKTLRNAPPGTTFISVRNLDGTVRYGVDPVPPPLPSRQGQVQDPRGLLLPTGGHGEHFLPGQPNPQSLYSNPSNPLVPTSDFPPPPYTKSDPRPNPPSTQMIAKPRAPKKVSNFVDPNAYGPNPLYRRGQPPVDPNQMQIDQRTVFRQPYQPALGQMHGGYTVVQNGQQIDKFYTIPSTPSSPSLAYNNNYNSGQDRNTGGYSIYPSQQQPTDFFRSKQVQMPYQQSQNIPYGSTTVASMMSPNSQRFPSSQMQQRQLQFVQQQQQLPPTTHAQQVNYPNPPTPYPSSSISPMGPTDNFYYSQQQPFFPQGNNGAMVPMGGSGRKMPTMGTGQSPGRQHQTSQFSQNAFVSPYQQQQHQSTFIPSSTDQRLSQRQQMENMQRQQQSQRTNVPSFDPRVRQQPTRDFEFAKPYPVSQSQKSGTSRLRSQAYELNGQDRTVQKGQQGQSYYTQVPQQGYPTSQSQFNNVGYWPQQQTQGIAQSQVTPDPRFDNWGGNRGRQFQPPPFSSSSTSPGGWSRTEFRGPETGSNPFAPSASPATYGNTAGNPFHAGIVGQQQWNDDNPAINPFYGSTRSTTATGGNPFGDFVSSSTGRSINPYTQFGLDARAPEATKGNESFQQQNVIIHDKVDENPVGKI